MGEAFANSSSKIGRTRVLLNGIAQNEPGLLFHRPTVTGSPYAKPDLDFVVKIANGDTRHFLPSLAPQEPTLAE